MPTTTPALRAADADSQKNNASEPTAAVVFEDGVGGVLRQKCGKCHNAQKHDGGLDVLTAESLLRGGESGAVIAAGSPAQSLLMVRIQSGEMPPEDSPALTVEETESIRAWIERGAKFRNAVTGERPIDEHDVIPILLLRCTVCHGTHRKEGGLDLRTRESVLKGGNGGPVVVAGRPEESRLVQRIHNSEMPPPRQLVSVSVKPATAAELETLKRWIAAGMPAGDARPSEAPAVSEEDRGFWSFQSPVTPPIPQVQRPHTNHPVDRFIQQRLERHGLTLAPAADRETLLRRVCLDLTGLPPSIELMDEFAADTRPDAWPRIIDRLLESSAYGEQWAHHWLDAAGYADSEGAQNEDRIRPHLWRYRDYVIRSLNSGKPYDRFLREQIAGDELADYEHADEITPEIYDNLVATGFLRTAPDRTFADITNFVPDRLEVIADEIQILGTSVLGLTLQCARCHSHKFDPVSQHDYYSLAAVLKDAYDEHDWLKSQGPRTLPHVTTTERREWQQHEDSRTTQINELRGRLNQTQDEAEKKTLQQQIDALNGQQRPEPRIGALWSRGQPSPTYLLRRGNYEMPGPLVQPAVPQVLDQPGNPYAIQPPWPEAKQTGRRLALARWLTHPSHPLTARVFVNRVWKLHFGRGIVSTVDNFGIAGAKPSHPELLDWLATEFVRNGWDIKWLHRLLLTSETWQQTSRLSATRSANESEQEVISSADELSEELLAALFHHMPLRRMDAETLRDSLLSLSGQLDRTQFGPPVNVDVRPDGLVTAQRSEHGWRRSIYVIHRRTQTPTMLENFDYPQMGPNCTDRRESIVAPQALHLMNNAMIHDLAGHFARRVRTEAGESPAEQIERIHRLALGRSPTDEERDIAISTLEVLVEQWRQADSSPSDTISKEVRHKALASYCHAIMNSAALVYVD